VVLCGVWVVVLGVIWFDGVGFDGWPRGLIEMWCLKGSLIGLRHTRVSDLHRAVLTSI
jgi:hypothetical protein